MAISVLILGESGTGKTYSMRNLQNAKIISVEKNILPFRLKKDSNIEMIQCGKADEIIKQMQNTDKKIIVVDDFQYLLGIAVMRRSLEKGWDKFSEIQYDYFKVLDAVKELPIDTIVYFLSHVENTEDGNTKIKTIGKALDKYITIEGLFSIVLGTLVTDGEYYFITQNNGKNTLKSPAEMFYSYAIDNDLAYVDRVIRNYYYMNNAVSDEEIKHESENIKQATDDIDENKPKRRKRKVRGMDDGFVSVGTTESGEPIPFN